MPGTTAATSSVEEDHLTALSQRPVKSNHIYVWSKEGIARQYVVVFTSVYISIN